MAVPLHHLLHCQGLICIYCGLVATIKSTGESRSRSQFLPRKSVLKINALLSQAHAYSLLMFIVRQETSQLLAYEMMFFLLSIISCLSILVSFIANSPLSTMVFSPVPVLFIPLIYFLYISLFCCASQDFFADCFPFEIFLPEIVLKAEVVTWTLPVSFLCHVSLPVPPSFSWPCALQVLCNQFFFFFSLLGGGCLSFFCACLLFSLSSDISFLLYFILMSVHPSDFSLWFSLQPPDIVLFIFEWNLLYPWMKICQKVRDEGSRWSGLKMNLLMWLEPLLEASLGFGMFVDINKKHSSMPRSMCLQRSFVNNKTFVFCVLH